MSLLCSQLPINILSAQYKQQEMNLPYIGYKKIGEGSFGKVYLANYHDVQVAIKKLDKKIQNSEAIFHREISNMRELYHVDGICKLYNHYDTYEAYYIVSEYASGVDLLRYMEQHKKPIPESRCKLIFEKLVKTLMEIHNRNYVHNDIKCENIMYDDDSGAVKVIDFGLSEKAKEKTRSDAGSLEYMSPQKLQCSKFILLCPSAYDPKKADIWALGVVLYSIASYEFPWARETMFSSYKLSRKYPAPKFKEHISEDLKDLLLKIFENSQDDRISLTEMLNHNWMKNS